MALPSSGAISLADIQTEFGGSNPISLSEYYGAAAGIPASGEITISDFYGASAFTLPTGLIIPYTGASTPSGWSNFTSANGKGIIGAGSTYSNGSTGGTLSKSVSLSTVGNHSNTNNGAAKGRNAGCQRQGTAGNHSHSATISNSAAHPPYKQYKFIKSGAGLGSIPANGIVLGVSTIGGAGVSNVDSGINRSLYAGSSVATGGSTTHSMTGTTSTNGNHVHPGCTFAGGDGSTRPYYDKTVGNHTHTASGTITLNPQRIYCTAWTNASADFQFTGNAIAMWESATPPTGWAICNGLNGTPDMRNYFVYIGTTGNHGTTSGNNSHSIASISAGGNATHNHTLANYGVPNEMSASHGSIAWSHTHTASNTTVSGPTPYYGLYFIMYTG